MINKFEDVLIQAEYWQKQPSPEERPYDFKYIARNLMINLRQELTNNQLLLAILDFHLGVNFLDCEENGQANIYFSKSLREFAYVDPIDNYLGYIQQIYNHLGFLAINRDENEVGLSILAKAEKLGWQLISQKQPQFIHKYEGNFEKVEQSYTLTLFYIAQAYTKLGFKDKCAQYCVRTMQRQYTSKTYELKDFCVNCVSLSEYYNEKGQVSQAIYFIQSGLSLIPENKKKKLRATLQMAMGKALGEFLSYSVDKIKCKSDQDQGLYNHINMEMHRFEGIDIKPITFKVCHHYEDIKSIYRQANTCYKRALEYFVLDGFVTEHIQIQQQISQMLKNLIQLEPEISGVVALQEKRQDILSPIMKALNPKAYQNTYDQLLVEVAEINYETYDFILSINYIDDLTCKNKKLADKMNKAISNTILYYRLIIESLFKLEENQRDHAYYGSLITAYFNIAKAQSKYFMKDKEEKVKHLIESLNTYKQVIVFIEQQGKQQEFQQIYQMAQEMLSILPMNIDRVNYYKK